MAKSNLNTQAKRKRELAKKDKRAAKDEKRAQKKAAARTGRTDDDGAPLPVAPVAPPSALAIAAAAFIRKLNKTP
jgi:hypothetical protein